MLQNLIKLKKGFKDKPYDIEYLIVDCSPGTGYSTVNVMLATDSSLFIVWTPALAGVTTLPELTGSFSGKP